MNEETVTIPKAEYEELLNDSLFLRCLKRSGVDEWIWYDDAIDDFIRLSCDDEKGIANES